jgi:acetyl esterase/lipase
MPSAQSAAISEYYRQSNAIAVQDPPLPLPELRDRDEHWGDLTAEPGGVDYLEVDAGGVRAMWAVPHGCAPDRVVLCLHGGGFIGGSIYTHRKLYGHLGKATGLRTLSVDYRRTPEHRYPAPHDDAATAYRWLFEKEGLAAGSVALAGDSAGGGLAVATALRARTEGWPEPAALALMSAWLDLAGTGATMVSNVERDVLFGGPTPMDAAGLVAMFLGPDPARPAARRSHPVPPTDPRVSPLYADLTGLPPTYLQVGDAERLLDDSRRFAERATRAGVSVKLDVFADQQHTFQMMAGRAPEADEAIAGLAAWLRPHLGLD